MKSEVPSEPVFFLKPETCLVARNRPFFYPDFSQDIHHEVELVLRINRVGRHIGIPFAHKYYDEIGIGIDFTARDVQAEMKKKGLPWEKAKAFDGAAPLSDRFLPKTSFADLNDISFHLEVNGQTVQQGNTRDLLFSFDQLISYISTFITLKKGDLIFTGTPEGVGPVQKGDRLTAFIGQDALLDFNVR